MKEDKENPNQEVVSALSLNEVVKKSVFAQWWECLQALKRINKIRVQVPDATDLGMGEYEFKTSVLALWIAIKNKLDYQPDAECAKALKALDKRRVFDSRTLTLEQAENSFDLITKLLETSGLTKYEQEQHGV